MDRAGAALLRGGSTDGGTDTGVRSTATRTIHHCSHNAPLTQWLQLRFGFGSVSIRLQFDRAIDVHSSTYVTNVYAYP